MKRLSLLVLFGAALLLSFPLQAETAAAADAPDGSAAVARPVEEVADEGGAASGTADCVRPAAELAQVLPDLAALLSVPDPSAQSGGCGYLWVDPACGPCGAMQIACETWCADKGGLKAFQGCDGFLSCECNNGCIDTSGCTCPPPALCRT